MMHQNWLLKQIGNISINEKALEILRIKNIRFDKEKGLIIKLKNGEVSRECLSN